MELPVKLPLAGVPDALPKDCQATYSRDRLSNTRVPPSSSSFSPRYRLTSIGAEKLIPWSREIETKVASVPRPIEEIQETAKVPSGETARDGAEALETSGGETAVTEGHVSPPSWDVPTLTYAHDPMPHELLAAFTLCFPQPSVPSAGQSLFWKGMNEYWIRNGFPSPSMLVVWVW